MDITGDKYPWFAMVCESSQGRFLFLGAEKLYSNRINIMHNHPSRHYVPLFLYQGVCQQHDHLQELQGPSCRLFQLHAHLFNPSPLIYWFLPFITNKDKYPPNWSGVVAVYCDGSGHNRILDTGTLYWATMEMVVPVPSYKVVKPNAPLDWFSKLTTMP